MKEISIHYKQLKIALTPKFTFIITEIQDQYDILAPNATNSIKILLQWLIDRTYNLKQQKKSISIKIKRILKSFECTHSITSRKITPRSYSRAESEFKVFRLKY